ncbi:Thioredoxin domain-containing protein [Spironucleus salmonicida]|uniref:Thioredoxin domain-containing protein n=1 Tax=Spironucleus salmonicida TaxID=348837 RepID=A0A9P8LXP6_9EUKA|nr:Thioredoxin domain-containing protein [Spironucleus salmonicida]
MLAVLSHVLNMQSAAGLEEALQANRYTFVKFYLAHCKHCQQLSPRFYDLSDAAPARVALAQFNCALDRVTCDTHGVDGVPGLVLFRGGQRVAEYDSLWRDVKPMRRWLEEQME